MKYPVITVLTALLSFVGAQETCESLLAGLGATLGQTATLTRETKVKAGFIEVASFTTLVEQTASGLEFTVLEGSGPNQRGADGSERQEGWLGPLDVNQLSCSGHTLNEADGVYRLELSAAEVPDMENLVLDIQPETYQLEAMWAKIRPPNMPFTAALETTFSDWRSADE